MSSMSRKVAAIAVVGGVVLGSLALAPSAIGAPPDGSPSDLSGDPGAVAALWTPEARAAAIPRDLVVDQRGLAYLKRPDGTLEPYGHSTPPQAQPPVVAVGGPAGPTPAKGGPGGSGDTTPPTFSNMDPDNNATVGSPYTLQATVTDPSGIRNATVYVAYGTGGYSSFRASNLGGDTWGVQLAFSAGGRFSWYMQAKDTSNNTGTSDKVTFDVSLSGGGSSGGSGGGSSGSGVVTNTKWTTDGTVQTAAGRLYFEMPANGRNRWTAYVCSGTAVSDSASAASLILTAAHCVYDDTHKAFARHVLFIPNQAGTTASGTNTTCTDDPLGCWTPTYGVVDVQWTNYTFPDNIPWDYAFYVVPTSGHHTQGLTQSSDSLEEAAHTLPISFVAPTTGKPAAALGYSYSDDPNLMYCQQDLGTVTSNLATGTATNWWLDQCALSGGASGGPWLQKSGGGVDGDSGPIISVNSWGYTSQPGMAGPQLSGTSASSVKSCAEVKAGSDPADGGYTYGSGGTC